MHHMIKSKSEPRKPRRISVTLSTQDLEFLQELAASRERSISWLAAHAIGLFLMEARKEPRSAARPEGDG